MKTKKRKHGSIKPESFQFDKETRVDADRGIVRNVKILGLRSRHGYDYSPAAAKAAVSLYEGAPVNVDHPERSKAGAARSYRDRFGKLQNVHFVEGDGIRGDLRYNPKHPIADQFAWDAKHNPTACGLSHNASGPLSPPRGSGTRPICESIEKVRSVDVVADAATNTSLFEGKSRMRIRSKKKNINPRKFRRQLMESFGRQAAKTLLEAVGDDPAAMQGMAGAMEAGGDEANVEALLALIKRVIADPNISAEDTIKLVSKRLKALKEMIPGGAKKNSAAAAEMGAGMEGLGDDPENDDDDDDDDEDGTHGRKIGKKGSRLQKLLTRLEAREDRLTVREMCEEANFKPSERQLSLLLEAKGGAREELLEEFAEAAEDPKKLRLEGRAKSTAPAETRGAKPKYETAKDWAKGLIA